MQYPYCAAYRGPHQSLCAAPCRIEGLTCSQHRGFYEPQRWFELISNDNRPQILEQHLPIALREKIHLQRKDMEFLPSSLRQVTYRSAEWASWLYVNNPHLNRSWSNPLWENCILKLCGLLTNETQSRAKFWIDRLLETKQDLLDFLKSAYFRNSIDAPLEEAYNILFQSLLEIRPHFAFQLDLEKDLFLPTRQFFRIHRPCTLEYDAMVNDQVRTLLKRTFGASKKRAIQAIRDRCAQIKEELIAKAWHPDRIERLIDHHGIEILEVL